MANKLKYTPDMFDEEKFNSKKHSKVQKMLFVFLGIYVAVIAVFMGLYFDFKSKFELVPVSGMSMQSTINPNTTDQSECDDYVYVRSGKSFSRGDIIVFNAKEYNGKEECLIKRVLALGGDYVSIRLEYDEETEKEHLAVCVVKKEDINENGKFDVEKAEIIKEEYVKDVEQWTYGYRTDPFAVYKLEPYGVKYYENKFLETFIYSGKYDTTIDVLGNIYARVPEGEFFYLGDNRYLSSDSRARGTESVDTVKGIVDKILPDANSSSTILLQIKSIFEYYGNRIGNYFSNLWVDLENYFAI